MDGDVSRVQVAIYTNGLGEEVVKKVKEIIESKDCKYLQFKYSSIDKDNKDELGFNILSSCDEHLAMGKQISDELMDVNKALIEYIEGELGLYFKLGV